MRFTPPMIRFKEKSDGVHLYVTSLRGHDGFYVRVVDSDDNKLFVWPATFNGFNTAHETDVYAIEDATTKIVLPVNDDTFFDAATTVQQIEIVADDGEDKKVLKKHEL